MRNEKEVNWSVGRGDRVAFGLGMHAARAATVVVSGEPSVVAEAAAREAIRQDTTWTSENI